ncbi:glycosyltransferase family 2 protein [Sandaracinus amylolyticus]|uniref:glycosyltransferase family 2 protein n=1 Tax=Sandaracinus amylolyticus TaxID=927083 RepID=UPI001F1DA888|nr:glycosyltransferase family 2 protein [Sandaracinus amylolyticus]UJR86883.1 Hypothetical protein I5071_89840 [Sandaracinus amylolyticus]
MTQPSISILVPHYNDPEGFLLTLKSVEAQTFRGPRELVVCDDGSTPQNLRRLHEIAEQSPERIVLLENGVNRGRPHTRNRLLDTASGTYLTWCDSGDELYPQKLALQHDALYRARLLRWDRPVWVTCHYDMHWVGGKPKHGRQTVEGDQISNLLLSSLRAYLFTLLGTTRSFRDVGYFDQKLPRLQDLDFFLRFAAKGGMFALPNTTEALCVYHKSDAGKDADLIADCYRHIFRKHSALLMTRSVRFRRNRLYDLNMLAARFASNNDDAAKTLVYMMRAAALNPVSFARKALSTKGRPWT